MEHSLSYFIFSGAFSISVARCVNDIDSTRSPIDLVFNHALWNMINCDMLRLRLYLVTVFILHNHITKLVEDIDVKEEVDNGINQSRLPMPRSSK